MISICSILKLSGVPSMKKVRTILGTNVSTLTIGRILGGNHTYLSTIARNSVSSGVLRRKLEHILMGVNWSIAVSTAMAGKRKNTIQTTSKYLNVNLVTSVRKSIVLIITLRRREGI